LRDWLVPIRKTEHASLQTQIRETLISAILDGKLALNEPVPSTRRMAKLMGVTRSTVLNAYQGLLEDGYLIARERSGYYVSEKGLGASPQYRLPLPRPPLPAVKRAVDSSPLWEGRLRLEPDRLPGLEPASDWTGFRFPFACGATDHRLFPLAEWRDCARQALGKRAISAWTGDSETLDDPMLVEQVRRRILPRRGITASDSQILVTLGAQNAFFLLASLLVGNGTDVAIEEPGSPDMRQLFAFHCGNLSLVEVDDSGLDPTALPERLDVLFTTPSHQLPTTVAMPAECHQALLAAAKERDFVIIEYDFEFETNYLEPCPALKSVDEEGRVIHAASLSRTMLPGLRLGFLVGPELVVEKARALRRLMIRHVPGFSQRTAALFLSHGHYDSLVRKRNRLYRKRREAMAAALGRHLPGSATVSSFGGTSIWVKGPKGLDSARLAQLAARRGVLLEPGHRYFAAAAQPCNFFRLGFSLIDESRIEPGIEIVAEIIAELSRS
jgi:GntR family transcriptional regulator/MocR family aminotransferase